MKEAKFITRYNKSVPICTIPYSWCFLKQDYFFLKNIHKNIGIYKCMCQHTYRTHKKLVTVATFAQGRRPREKRPKGENETLVRCR